METLKIAVQKTGRLSEDTLKLLSDCDINLLQGKRKLISVSDNFPVEILYLRDDNIPQYVSDGVADAGIVGENEVMERGKPVTIVKRLGFAKCRMSLAIPQDDEYTGLDWFSHKRIATSYPNILKEFFGKKEIIAKLETVSGSVEIAPGIGLSDAIFDIVSSGSTLVSNRLKEVEVVCNSEAVLITTNILKDAQAAVLQDLIFRIDTVNRSKGNKYILMNAPNDRLEEIISLLPGMKSPTIMPLYEKGWSSVHSVVGENDFWRIVGKLKEKGAEGILVIPIEKLIP